ncbi:hypothetical protein [Hydrogenimonas sp.]
MDWIEQFKIALVEEDEERLSSMMEIPHAFETLKEMREAQALIRQAIEMFEKRKSVVSEEMESVERSKKFFSSSEIFRPVNKLDITS